MKKYILAAVMVLGALAARAQKLDKPRIHKISGDTTLLTKEQVLANPFTIPGHYLAGNIMKGKDYYLLSFHLKDGMDIQYSVLSGDKAIVKFTDGKLLEIKAIGDTYSSLISYANPAVSESFLAFDLTDSDVEELKNRKVAVIRINTSMGPFDYDIKDGKSEIIKKQLELISKK